MILQDQELELDGSLICGEDRLKTFTEYPLRSEYLNIASPRSIQPQCFCSDRSNISNPTNSHGTFSFLPSIFLCYFPISGLF